MITIKDPAYVPPGGWRYVQPETGMFFSERADPSIMVRQIVVHREYKELPRATYAEVWADVQEQICYQIDACLCQADPGETYTPVPDKTTSLTMAMAKSLNAAILAFLAQGAQFVDKEEATRRALICRGCPSNKPASSCPCATAYKAIEFFIPSDRKFPDISVCMACGCSLQAKVNLPMSVVAESLAPDQVFPPWCWQKEAQTLET